MGAQVRRRGARQRAVEDVQIELVEQLATAFGQRDAELEKRTFGALARGQVRRRVVGLPRGAVVSGEQTLDQLLRAPAGG